MSGTTSDGLSSAPINVQVECKYYNISGRTTVTAQWDPPLHPEGKIISYQIVLNGFATYRSETGELKNETYGPKIKSVNEKPQRAEYDGVQFNTNYTVKVSGVTRSRKSGAEATASCTMQRSVPEIGHPFWGKSIIDFDKWIIKLYLQRLSERNGPICGYRVYLVRLPQAVDSTNGHLPPIDELDISTYQEVHAVNNTRGGAYIAETLSTDIFQKEIFLGDGHSVKNDANIAGFKHIQNEGCRKLLNGYFVRKTKVATLDSAPTEATELDGTNDH